MRSRVRLRRFTHEGSGLVVSGKRVFLRGMHEGVVPDPKVPQRTALMLDERKAIPPPQEL